MNDNIRKCIQTFAADNVTSSIELAVEALGIMWKFYYDSPPEIIRRDIQDVALAVIEAQPSMAAVINIVNRAALLAERSEKLVRMETLSEAMQQIESELNRDIEQAISAAAYHLRKYKKIATYSRSRLVEETFVEMLDFGYNPDIYISESRPGLEGLILAENLIDVGLNPTICVDAGLPELIGQSDALIIGADAVTEDRFCNKIGTGMMCKAAKEAGVPVFVIISRDKYLAGGLVAHYKIKNFTEQSIFEKPYQGATIYNSLFEWNSNELVTSFIGQNIFAPDFPGGMDADVRVARALRSNVLEV